MRLWILKQIFEIDFSYDTTIIIFCFRRNVTYLRVTTKTGSSQLDEEQLPVPACDMKTRLQNIRHMCSALGNNTGSKLPK